MASLVVEAAAAGLKSPDEGTVLSRVGLDRAGFAIKGPKDAIQGLFRRTHRILFDLRC